MDKELIDFQVNSFKNNLKLILIEIYFMYLDFEMLNFFIENFGT